MKRRYLILTMLLFCTVTTAGLFAQNHAPQVSNVTFSQRADGSYKVDIYYDLYDADGDAMTVSMQASADAGASFNLTAISLSGHIGANITSGTGKHIVWDFGADHPQTRSDQIQIKIIANDNNGTPGNYEMVLVNGGTFTMGDTWGDGSSDETPTHSVTLSSFYMGKYEITNAEVAEVYNWALDRSKISASSSTVQNSSGNRQELLVLNAGYAQISYNGSRLVVDSGKENYPVIEITWYGAAAFCNYLSEKEGYAPVYNLSDWSADFSKNGYRLPTEAQWEYAAKGGANGNYTKYSGSNTVGDVAWYWDNSATAGNSNIYSGHGTLPIGTKQANELGIYDMSGNVWEWCGDWYDSYGSAAQTNPTGPATGSYRVARGGGWYYIAFSCRVANRLISSPSGSSYSIGFRLVRLP